MFKSNQLKSALIAILISVILASCTNSSSNAPSETKDKKTDSNPKAAVYQCPMDCEKGKTYDKPGKCPVCEMELVKK